MAVTQKQLALAVLTTSAATVYTVPSGTRTVIWKATVENVTAGVETMTLYFVPSGGSADDSTTIAKDVSVPVAAAGPVVLDVANHVLPAGATIRAVASANTSLTLAISGVEVS